MQSFIEKNDLLRDGATVIVAVSGGADSLALLHFLAKQRHERSLKLICAHVNHELRGEQSLADYQFVERFCRERQIQFAGASLNVKRYAEEKKVSIQIAARECRYQFFRELIEQYNADYLALAHHGDDQIETMLMRQVRGNVGESLAGIAVKRRFARAQIVRPFLCVEKADIFAYCEREKLTYRHDESNDSDDYTRNRFRRHMVPFIKKENKQAHLLFQKRSEWLREDEAFLNKLAKEAVAKAIVTKENERFILSVSAFLRMPFPLQRRAVHLILNYLYGKNPQSLKAAHIEQILSLIHSDHPSRSCYLPKLFRAIKSYDQLIISRFENERQKLKHELLSIPGTVETALGLITARLIEAEASKLDPFDIVYPQEAFRLPLAVRTREKGDRMEIVGLNGTKQLRRIFIDKKIERIKREHWPVVTDATGKIIWLPGLYVSPLPPVTEMSQKYVRLTFEEKEETFMIDNGSTFFKI